jgi:hypothetical protein
MLVNMKILFHYYLINLFYFICFNLCRIVIDKIHHLGNIQIDGTIMSFFIFDYIGTILIDK